MDLHPAPGRSLDSGSGCAHAAAAFSGARVWRIEDTWLSSLCKPTSRCSPVAGLLPSSQLKVSPVSAVCALWFGRENRCPCRDVFGDDGVGPVIGSLPSACTTAASSPAPTRPAAAIHKKNGLEKIRHLVAESRTVGVKIKLEQVSFAYYQILMVCDVTRSWSILELLSSNKNHHIFIYHHIFINVYKHTMHYSSWSLNKLYLNSLRVCKHIFKSWSNHYWPACQRWLQMWE